MPLHKARPCSFVRGHSQPEGKCWDGMGSQPAIFFALCQQVRLRYIRVLLTRPSNLFFPTNPRSLGGDVASDGDFLIFEGNRYSRKGFLFKSFAMSAVVRVPECVVLMVVGREETKLSLPPVQALKQWVICPR